MAWSVRRIQVHRAQGLCAVFAVLLALGGLVQAQEIRFFRIGTGATSGTYFSLGGVIANAISNPPGSRSCEQGGSCGVPGLIAVAQSTQGSVENVEAIVEDRLDSGLVQADVAYWAYHGTGLFRDKGPSRELRAIANLLVSSVHIVVRADSAIREVAQLAGKRVSLGERGSGSLILAKTILAAYGLSEEAIEPTYHKPGPASDLLHDGALDAFFVVGAVPVTAVADLADRMAIRLLPVSGTTADELGAFYPFFAEAVIEAGTYRNVAHTASLGISTQWLVAAGADDDFVHALTRSLWHERSRTLFDNGPPEAASLHLQGALKYIAIPLHPGARRYYDEHGIKR